MSVLNSVAPYSKEIGALVIALLIAVFTRAIQPRAKLIHSVRHQFHYLLQEPIRDQEGQIVSPTQNVKIMSMSTFNSGRSTATKVELVFNWKPQFFNVWPLRHFEEREHSDRRFSIILESLAPKESFGVELLAVNRELPDLCNVRSEQCESVEKEMRPQIVVKRSLMVLLWIFLTAGFVTTIYLVLSLIQWSIG